MTLEEALHNYPGTDDEFYQDLSHKIYDLLVEKTSRKSIRFSFHKEATDVSCSKLGGIPTMFRRTADKAKIQIRFRENYSFSFLPNLLTVKIS